MPLYEYQCDACGRRFEKIQKFSDPPIEVCPTCGGHVQKLVSSPAFQFKGTGWYITDYSRKDKGGSDGEKSGSSGAGNAPAAASGDKGSAASTDSGGSSSGSDSKPAAAPAKDAPASTTKS
jgi:putative FmdB family regulatory protein